MEAAVWISESHRKPLYPYIFTCKFTCKFSLKRVIGLIWGFWFLLMLDPHWDFSWIPSCCPVWWRSSSFGYAELALHVFQQIRGGVDVGVGQLITLVLGLGCCRVGLPYLHLQVSSPALPWLVHPLQWWTRVGASSPDFLSSVLALPHLCQLYCTSFTRFRGHSPECCRWWRTGIALPLLQPQDQLSYLPKVGWDEGGGQISPATSLYSRWGTRSDFSHNPVSRVSSTVRPRQGAGTISWILQLVIEGNRSLVHHRW